MVLVRPLVSRGIGYVWSLSCRKTFEGGSGIRVVFWRDGRFVVAGLPPCSGLHDPYILCGARRLFGGKRLPL